MLDTIIPKIKGFLFNPVETFQNSRMDEPRAVLVYFGVLLLFYSLVNTLFYLAMRFLEFALVFDTMRTDYLVSQLVVGPAFLFISYLIVGPVIMFILSLWVHLWVFLLGGQKGFMKTFRAIFYSMTPHLLLGCIFIMTLFTPFWTLILMFFGIRELQEISDGRAFTVILISMVVPVVVLIVLFIVTLLYPAMVANLVSPSP